MWVVRPLESTHHATQPPPVLWRPPPWVSGKPALGGKSVLSESGEELVGEGVWGFGAGAIACILRSHASEVGEPLVRKQGTLLSPVGSHPCVCQMGITMLCLVISVRQMRHPMWLHGFSADVCWALLFSWGGIYLAQGQ